MFYAVKNISKYNIERNLLSLAAFRNIIEMCKIGTFKRNITTIFLTLLNIHLFSLIFQKAKF